MKTKLTLLTVLAAALFGVGCAGVPKPDVANAIKWNGHWYALYNFEGGKTWHEAKKHCEELGGHLMCVESKSEEEFIFRVFANKADGHHIWLGATDEHKEGDWRWVNGKSLDDTYHNFRGVNPNDAGGHGPVDDRKRAGQHYLRVSLTRPVERFSYRFYPGSVNWDDYEGGKFKVLICEWE
jgi:hypothetical protein